jgi:hypothetical protein
MRSIIAAKAADPHKLRLHEALGTAQATRLGLVLFSGDRNLTARQWLLGNQSSRSAAMDRSIEDPPNVGDVARQAVSDVVDAAHDNITVSIRRNPLQSVAIAVCVGFILALIVR